MKNRKIEIKWAVIFIVMQLLWMTMEKLTGLHDEHIEQHPIYTNLIAVPSVLIYILALIEKRKKDFGGFMTYGQGFISGLIITLIVTVFSPLVQWLTSSVISPDYFANAIEYAVETGAMPRAEAEEYFNQESYIMQVLLGTPVMGILTTAIIAIFVKKKPKAEVL